MNPQDFWRIYKLLYRKRWLALTVFGSCFGVVLLGCLVMPRYYRASSLVMPSEKALTRPVIPGASMAPSGNGANANQRQDESTFVTLVGLAKTGEVLQGAGNALHLDMTPTDLAELVTVEPGQGTLIKITALSRTSDGAVSLANAIAHAFSERYQYLASTQAKSRRAFLAGEVEKAEGDRDKAKVALQTYKAQQREAALPPGEKENPFLTQFYALRAQQEAAQSELQSVGARIAAVRSSLASQSPTKQLETSTSDNPETKQLQDQLAKLEGDLLLAQTKFTEKHRTVRDLKVQISDIRDRLSKQVSRMVTHRTITANPTHEKLAEELVDLTSQQASLRGRLEALGTAMGENEQRAGHLADTSVVLIAKTREYDTPRPDTNRPRRCSARHSLRRSAPTRARSMWSTRQSPQLGP